MLAFAVIFIGLGLTMLVAGLVAAGPSDRLPLALAGLVFAGVGAVPLAFVPRTRRQSRRARGLVPATAGAPVAGSTLAEPWPVETVASALADVFEGSPYVVEHNADTIEVSADRIAEYDRTALTRWTLDTMLSVRLAVRRPGVFERTDTVREVVWTDGGLALGRALRTTSGWTWHWRRRIEFRLGPGGVHRAVDVTWSTDEVVGRLREVTQRAGWRIGLGPTARGALIVGCIGGSAIVLVPLALLLQWLAGR
jgi:hypothetical protein